MQIQRSKGEPLPEPLTLRIIDYRLNEQIAEPLAQLQRSRGRTGTRKAVTADQVYRLATTLLDPVAARPKRSPRAIMSAGSSNWSMMRCKSIN